MAIFFILLYYIFIFGLGIIEGVDPPRSLNIGLFGDKYQSDGEVDENGILNIAAMLLALSEINNKSDGLYDDILPKTHLKFALRSTKGDFLEGSNGAQDFALRVFNGSGVVGVIGTGHDQASRAMGQTFGFTPFKVNNVDYGANASDLSHGSYYPYYVRTCASNAYEGRILARLIKQHFKWGIVSVFSTADTYGTDISSEFFNEAIVQGISIEHKYSIWPGTTNFESILETTKSTGILKVFVLLMKSNDAAMFLEAGYNAQLFKEGTQILGTQYILTPVVWNTMSKDAPKINILKGIIGIKPILNRNTNNFQLFLKRYLQQTSTKITHSNNTIECNLNKDDDGNTFLYIDKHPITNSFHTKCAGVNFSSLATDGTNIPDTAIYAYDAVYGLALSLHKLLYEQKNYHFSGSDLGILLLNRTYMRYDGVSGLITFSPGHGGSEGYGLGDRETGLIYKVYNFNPNFYNNDNNDNNGIIKAYRTIGNWISDNNNYIPCDISKDIDCSQIIYNTINNEIIDDTATIIEIQMSDISRILLRAGGGVCLFITLWFLFIVLLYIDTRLIKSAQPSVLFIILFGGMLAGIKIILATMDITDTLCIIGKWLGHLSFILVFGAIIIRTWRISKVVNSGFSKVRITKNKMLGLFAFVIFLFCMYLLMDTIIGQPHRSYEESFDGHYSIHKIKCESRIKESTFVLFAIEGLLLLYGGNLCYGLKNAPTAVDDSKYITLALFLIVFICAVTFPIVFLSIEPTPQTLIIIMASGFMFATICVLFILFLPKTNLLLEGADVDETLNIVRSVDASGKSPRRSSNLRNKLISRMRSQQTSHNCQSQSPGINGREIGRSRGVLSSRRIDDNNNNNIDNNDGNDSYFYSGKAGVGASSPAVNHLFKTPGKLTNSSSSRSMNINTTGTMTTTTGASGSYYNSNTANTATSTVNATITASSPKTSLRKVTSKDSIFSDLAIRTVKIHATTNATSTATSHNNNDYTVSNSIISNANGLKTDSPSLLLYGKTCSIESIQNCYSNDNNSNDNNSDINNINNNDNFLDSNNNYNNNNSNSIRRKSANSLKNKNIYVVNECDETPSVKVNISMKDRDNDNDRNSDRDQKQDEERMNNDSYYSNYTPTSTKSRIIIDNSHIWNDSGNSNGNGSGNHGMKISRGCNVESIT